MLRMQQLISSTILASVALASCATDQEQDGADTAPLAQIESARDLDIYLRNTASSPLSHLSPAAKQRFLNSLVFTANGLGSYQYSDLEVELSPAEICQILSLFGVEHTAELITGVHIPSGSDKAPMQRRPRADYKGYKCSGPGSCYTDTNSICTSNC